MKGYTLYLSIIPLNSARKTPGDLPRFFPPFRCPHGKKRRVVGFLFEHRPFWNGRKLHPKEDGSSDLILESSPESDVKIYKLHWNQNKINYNSSYKLHWNLMYYILRVKRQKKTKTLWIRWTAMQFRSPCGWGRSPSWKCVTSIDMYSCVYKLVYVCHYVKIHTHIYIDICL